MIQTSTSTQPHRPDRVEQAQAIMDRFAERTGLTSDGLPVRYLWTDAFAVKNDLALARLTGEPRFRQRALALVEQVHRVLGSHRDDDPRQGWLRGASTEHPTRGGLRIGKSLPERRAGEPIDQRLEWDRDGQYFHYLTRWMEALDAAAEATDDDRYRRWAIDLAEAAHRAFTMRQAGDAVRMVWKMSIDLSRALVPSMGHHDPLDGLVTYSQIQQGLPGEPLKKEIDDFAAMVRGRDLTTSDALGLGGLLQSARRAHELAEAGHPVAPGLVFELLRSAERGLEHLAGSPELRAPAEYRLAFRELGLAIGLSAIEDIDAAAGTPSRQVLERLRRYRTLGDRIVEFWSEPRHQRAATWTEHRNINEVMLATALLESR